MVGKVTEISGDYIYCKTVSATFSGQEVKNPSPEFRTTVQGSYAFDSEENPRIVLIS